MSYILDALRKAERERHLGQPPSLTTPSLGVEPGGRRLGPWLWVGLGLGLNAALLAFFLAQTQPVAPPVTAQEPAQPVASTRSTALTATTLSAAPAPATPRKEPANKPVLSEPSPPTVPRASRERREDPIRSPVTPGSVTLAPVPAPVPLLETLSTSARRGIPALSLDIHVHSSNPDKRFVVINGRRYREGEQLGEGPVLETVTGEGAILRQGGQRFQLSVRR